MDNPAPSFCLPKSHTGRMSHNQLQIQLLPSLWQENQEATHTYVAKTRMGKLMSAQQQTVERIVAGDLVVWAPDGKPGLWLVTDIHPGGGLNVDYASIERSIAFRQNNPCSEIALNDGAKTVLRQKYVRRHEVPQGSLRLTWEGGWAGWGNDRRPVVVKIETVHIPNEMEVLGIAAL